MNSEHERKMCFLPFRISQSNTASKQTIEIDMETSIIEPKCYADIDKGVTYFTQ